MSRPLPGIILLQPLHLGRSTHVWLARLDGVDDAVAVKRVADPDDVPSRERLRAEADRAAAVAHPDLLRPLTVIDDGPGLAVAYPYLPGGSLRTLLEHRGALTAGEVVAVLQPVAAALAASSSFAEAHGDLKPENVLLRADGSPVVADAAPPGHGTPAYLDPAVAAGAAPSARSDVYALGVIAYEALTGRRPHRGRPAEVVALAGAGAHRSLTSWPGIEPEVARIVEQALAAEPEQRPKDPVAFVTAIAAAVDPSAIVLPGPTPGPPRNVARPGTDTIEFGPRPPVPDEDDVVRSVRWGWVAGVGASAVAVAAISVLGPVEDTATCATPEVGPGTVAVDLDGDGCDDLARWDGSVLTASTNGMSGAALDGPRLRIGGPGAQVRFGDWDGDGGTSIATYEPASGVVRYVDDLNEPTVERTVEAPTDGDAVVVPGADGDLVEVRRR